MSGSNSSPLSAAFLGYLPIVREYAERMGFIELINKALDCRMHVEPGKLVLAMVMNVLMGRSPLYRVEEFYRSRATALLLGEVNPEQLNDDALGRLLDRIWEFGTWRLFSAISLESFKRFGVDCRAINHDTSSVSVWGGYPNHHSQAVTIDYGPSKDKRPDLKQFILSLLCVEGNLALAASIRDGHTSDKTINTTLVSTLPGLMSRHGLKKKDFTLIVDAALVTEQNLAILGTTGRFITRLPATYTCCGTVIQQTVSQGKWVSIGSIGDQSRSHTRKKATYRVQEGHVELYGQSYRVVIVHSDVYDQRRKRKLARQVDRERQAVEKQIKAVLKQEFYCLPDAQQAAASLPQAQYHTLSWSIHTRPVYGRGRPSKDGHRQPQSSRFLVSADLKPDEAAISQAGCFVLLTSLPLTEVPGADILRLYKSQDGIERNFSFFKDPLVMNDLFLKNTRRIEALSFILVLALLLWRLMERTMRQSLKKDGHTVPGWENRPTTKPTSFMMASKFSSLLTVNQRLIKPLQYDQLKFLQILDVHPSVLTQYQPGPHYWPG